METDLIWNEEMNEEESIEWLLQVGGDNATDRVADIIQHIVDMKYTNA